MRIETERLRLEALTGADAGFIRRVLNEPSFLHYIGDRGVRNAEDARRYIREGPVAMYARHGYGLMRVSRREDGVPIGICGLLKRDALPDPDLGFSLLPEWWSQGYAYEAAAAALADARARLSVGRILAITVQDNAASARLLERLGFRFDRLLRLADDAADLRLYVSEP